MPGTKKKCVFCALLVFLPICVIVLFYDYFLPIPVIALFFFSAQIIKLLSYVHGEVVKAQLGQRTPITCMQKLTDAAEMPKPQLDAHVENDIFSKTVQEKQANSEQAKRSRLQWMMGQIPFQLERRPSKCTPPGMDRGRSRPGIEDEKNSW